MITNPALMLQWAAAACAQRKRGASVDTFAIARHFGLERVSYESIPRFLSHARYCPGMSNATRECAAELFTGLVGSSSSSKNKYTCSLRCSTCGPIPSWDMTTALGRSKDELYAYFDVDLGRLPRHRSPTKRPYGDVEGGEVEEEDEPETKRMAILAHVVNVF